jgi:hypothetical protein
MNNLLYRVKNLSKSNDKRLQKRPIWFAARKRGAVGTLITITPDGWGGQYTDIFGDNEIFILNDPTQVSTVLPFGVYHRDELELVTEQQLKLEQAVLGLLTIFPNHSPELALTQKGSIDDLRIAHLTVKRLRKLLKNHPIMQQLRLRRRINRAQMDYGVLTTEFSLANDALDLTAHAISEIFDDLENTQNRIDKYKSKLEAISNA